MQPDGQACNPGKHAIRAWLAARRISLDPPPAPAVLRHELNWSLSAPQGGAEQLSVLSMTRIARANIE